MSQMMRAKSGIMFSRDRISERRKKQFTCYHCNESGLWWHSNGTQVAMSSTKNSYTPHKCCGRDNVYKVPLSNEYETKSAEELYKETRARLNVLFGEDFFKK